VGRLFREMRSFHCNIEELRRRVQATETRRPQIGSASVAVAGTAKIHAMNRTATASTV
jgi:hypothetical protein